VRFPMHKANTTLAPVTLPIVRNHSNILESWVNGESYRAEGFETGTGCPDLARNNSSGDSHYLTARSVSSIKRDVKKKTPSRPEWRLFLEIQPTVVALPWRSLACGPFS
jgi:hypothetical protein